jgi:hypothetical protein
VAQRHARYSNRLVPHTLQIGDGLDDGDEQPKVACHRLAPGQEQGAVLIDFELHIVDFVVTGNYRFCQLAVLLLQRLKGVP